MRLSRHQSGAMSLVKHVHKCSIFYKSITVFPVKVSCWFCSLYLFECRLPGNHFSYGTADSLQHSGIGQKVAFVADRAVAGDDDRLVIRHGQHPLKRIDGAFYGSTAARVYERVHAGEVDISRVDNVCFPEPDDRVTIGMCVTHMAGNDLAPINHLMTT